MAHRHRAAHPLVPKSNDPQPSRQRARTDAGPRQEAVGPRARGLGARRLRLPGLPGGVGGGPRPHRGRDGAARNRRRGAQAARSRRPDHRHPHHHGRTHDRGGCLAARTRPSWLPRSRSTTRPPRRSAPRFTLREGCRPAPPTQMLEAGSRHRPARRGRTPMSRKQPEDQARRKRPARVDRSLRTHIFDGEEVVLVAHPGRLATLPRIVLTLGLYSFWRKRDTSALTDQRILLGTGILGRRERSIPLARHRRRGLHAPWAQLVRRRHVPRPTVGRRPADRSADATDGSPLRPRDPSTHLTLHRRTDDRFSSFA